MQNKLLGKAILIAYAHLGIQIDNIEESDSNVTIYISVPKDADLTMERDAHGNVMAGHHLAKTINKKLIEMGITNIELKYRIREEQWTKSKALTAESEMKKQLKNY